MKKEIEQLLNSANATLKVNQYCTLHRRTKNPLYGDDDVLEVYFNLRSAYSYREAIISRDWRGVIEEVKAVQIKAFALEAEELNKELNNGTLLGRVDDNWSELDEQNYQGIIAREKERSK